MHNCDSTKTTIFITKRPFSILLLLLSIIPAMASTSWCAESAFGKLEYGGFLSVEIPKHWIILDENSKKNMNNFSEAVLKLKNVELNQGNNNILISANSYNSSSNFPVASIRVSVRPGKTDSQDDIKKIAGYSEADLKEYFVPLVTPMERMMLSISGCKTYKVIDTNIAKNLSVSCLYTEAESNFGNGTMISQTYLCPMGDKNVKLATSYLKTQKMQFKPILDYVWSSLSVK